MGKVGTAHTALDDIRRTASMFSARKHWPVIVTLLMGTTLSVGAFYLARRTEDRSLLLDSKRQAQIQIDATGNLIGQYWQETSEIGNLFRASSEVLPDEFRIFTSGTLAHRSSVVALEWAPRISEQERSAFEERMRRHCKPDYAIWQLNENGVLAPAGQRSEYFPIALVEPDLYRTALGIDMGTRPIADEALRRAGQTGRIYVSRPVRLFKTPGTITGVLAFAPVYRTPEVPTTPEARWEALRGFAIGAYNLDSILNEASHPFSEAAFPVKQRLYLRDNKGLHHLIASQGESTLAESAVLTEAQVNELTAYPHIHASQFDSTGQPLLIIAETDPAALARLRTSTPALLLAGGLLLTWILSAYVWMLLNRTAQIATLVAKRTSELALANEGLREENNRRLAVEHDLSRALAKERDAHEVARQARQELAVSEARYRLMGETVPYGVWLFDADGEPQYFSDSFLHLLQMTLQDTRHFGWTRRLAPEEVDVAITTLTSALQTGEMWDTEHRFIGPDCKYHTILVRGLPLRDIEGKIISWVGINLDITQRKQAEEELRQHRDYLEEIVRSRTLELMLANEELRRDIEQRNRVEDALRKLQGSLEEQVRTRTAELAATNRELEAFSYSVSHDLRAPLRHIVGFVQLLQKQAADRLDEVGQRHLQVITQAATRMGRLIDDLLKFSRLGRAAMRIQPVDLATLIDDVRDELTAALEPDREVEWSIHPLPAVRADPALLRITMVNLLGNALKYSRTRPTARIEVGASQEDANTGLVTLYVRDNGVGFDMQYADRLFGVFQRLHTAEEFEGTGIGLAMVQRIIHRHGGTIWADAQANGGATFYFSLPEAVETDAPLETNLAGRG